jgi:hypothetical protein
MESRRAWIMWRCRLSTGAGPRAVHDVMVEAHGYPRKMVIMSISDTMQIIGTLAVVVSLLILAWQTRQLSRQTAVGNAVGITGAHHSVLERQHDVYRALIDHPELAPYFLAGRPCPPDDPNRSRAVVLGEMLGDIHDLGLEITRRFPDPTHADCWKASTIAALQQPILVETFHAYAHRWWPELAAHLTDLPTSPDQPDAPGTRLPLDSPSRHSATVTTEAT